MVQLEQSACTLERHRGRADEERWLLQIIAPGSSLGGTRPKAAVVDEEGHVWIAKFPSAGDGVDTGAWKMVAHDLALAAGLVVPKAQVQRASPNGTTFLSQRFDRDARGRRIHFCSALSLLEKVDGDHGSSYLELVQCIRSNATKPQQDLQQLFRRTLFSIAISNTDDQLRNHGFMLSQRGWDLSMAYDLNPDPLGGSLSLAIDEANHGLDFSLALGQHGVLDSVSRWAQVARSYGIPKQEIALMARSFNLSQ